MSFTRTLAPDDSALTLEQREEIERNWDEMCAEIQSEEDAAAAQGRDYWADQFASRIQETLPPTVEVPDSDDLLLSAIRAKVTARGLHIAHRLMVALVMLEREALVARGMRLPLSREESDVLRQRWGEQLERLEQSSL